MDAITSVFNYIGLSSSSSSSSSSSKPLFLKIDQLNDKQKEALEVVATAFPDASKEDLLGYLKVRDFKPNEAIAQYKTSLLWRQSNMHVSILDVAPFILKPPNCEGFDGGMYVLEDMKGDCARDIHGRPVVYIQGMLHGTIDEMLKQMIYCMKRASIYHKQGSIKCSTVILDSVPKTGCNTTFRFPDAESKQLMNYQKLHFPGSLSSTTHICGIPSYIVWAFALCKPFMDEEAYNNMLVKPDFSHLLQNYVTKENLPVECGGELVFDVKKYVQWRADEEGVNVNYEEFRRYDPTNTAQVSELDMKQSLMQTTSHQLIHGEMKPTKHGILSKQGSGKGFFANYKWKEKFVAVGPGGICYYFDSPDISDTNKVSTVISLTGGYIELLEKDSVGYSFQLVTSERNYVFSCQTESDRNDWIVAFNEQFSIGDLTNDYQKKLHKQQQQQQQQKEEELVDETKELSNKD